jgi:hypothetical protein
MSKEIIKRLQDKTYVRAFGLMSSEEQAVYVHVGTQNCIVFRYLEWIRPMNPSAFSNDFTYAIKPDYKPEPEYIDLEIKATHNRLYADPEKGSGLTGRTTLHKLVSRPNFECFWYDTERSTPPLNLCEVSKIHNQGKQVYARLRKEQE